VVGGAGRLTAGTHEGAVAVPGCFAQRVVSWSLAEHAAGPVWGHPCAVTRMVLPAHLGNQGQGQASASPEAHVVPSCSRPSYSRTADSARGGGHGGTRDNSTLRPVQTGSVGRALQVMLVLENPRRRHCQVVDPPSQPV